MKMTDNIELLHGVVVLMLEMNRRNALEKGNDLDANVIREELDSILDGDMSKLYVYCDVLEDICKKARNDILKYSNL
jgi:hypothetical protein